jgi:hypothetical protein
MDPRPILTMVDMGMGDMPAVGSGQAMGDEAGKGKSGEMPAGEMSGGALSSGTTGMGHNGHTMPMEQPASSSPDKDVADARNGRVGQRRWHEYAVGWQFHHCHLSYRMEAGMFREVIVS